jgi:hypothetical protein
MQRPLKQFLAESRILKGFLVFFFAYLVLLIFWIQVKDGYRYGITVVASKFVAGLKDARLEEVTKNGTTISAYFSSLKARHIRVGGKVAIASGSINFPLTFSLMVSLSMFIRRRQRAFLEALLLLLIFDFFLVFVHETWQLTTGFMSKGIEEASPNLVSFYEFLWNAMDFSSRGFEPFLIVTYIYIRFRKQAP